MNKTFFKFAVKHNVVFGPSHEKCLQDLITYLQLKGEEIHCLLREADGKEPHSYICYITHLKDTPFRSLIDKRRSDMWKNTKEVDLISQEDINDWCKSMSDEEKGIDEENWYRDLFTVSSEGVLYKYHVYTRFVEELNGTDVKQSRECAILDVYIDVIY